ncbi:hypothetical protein EK21DRAFT_81445 [Setomelanomma holmii]|uniref:DUF7730 domain-containing protein n=1 Tax=Setomelanomma holmii TaxID=210430 RepID=A0A9P4GWD5_9PLEO|nr:hypothetical protein EK21DRAFT_81445 [Setomelanomma holmii]
MRRFIDHALRRTKLINSDQSNPVDMEAPPQPHSTVGPAHLQNHCAIFGQLSADLRLLIHEAVLSDPDRLLHIVPYRCYVEAFHVLYDANTFSFNGAACIPRFRSILTVNNWNTIRRMNLSTVFKVPMELSPALKYIPPENYNEWAQNCEVVGTLKGLRWLFIDMTIWNYHDYKTTNTPDDRALIFILSHLRAIPVKFMEVEMNVDISEAVKSALEPMDFTITKRHRPYNTRVFRQA